MIDDINIAWILAYHQKWLDEEPDGIRANLSNFILTHVDLSQEWLTNIDFCNADLQWANLYQAHLHDVNLQGANLSSADLRGAYLPYINLRNANLCNADLSRAYLRWADLRYTDLRGANLFRADLRGADLRGANLDYSVFPLWCGSKGIRFDRELAAQLAAHFCAIDCDDPDYLAAREAVIGFARTSHRAEVLGLTEEQ
jgi:hypothetical protein